MSDFILVDRHQWGAKYSAGRKAMPKRVSEINVHHSVTVVSGPEGYDSNLDPTDDPCKDMRTLERVLHERGLAPGYSFVFHPSGVILVGAGGNVGAHTAGRNSISYGFCLMGNYDIHQPTFAQFAAMGWMLNVLRFVGAVEPNLDRIRIQGHRATKATACPGANVANKIHHIKTFAKAL